MTIFRRMSFCCFFILMYSFLAQASSSTNNWNVDGMNGAILAHGELITSPCFLSPESEEQEIKLGSFSSLEGTQPGAVTTPVVFHLILDGCPDESSVTESLDQMQGKLYLSGQTATRLKITGEAQTGERHLFRVHGGASGIALHIEDSQGEAIRPGMLSRPQILTPGRNDLIFFAQLWRTSERLMAGELRSVVNVSLEYE